jgi:hypothetical protein
MDPKSTPVCSAVKVYFSLDSFFDLIPFVDRNTTALDVNSTASNGTSNITASNDTMMSNGKAAEGRLPPDSSEAERIAELCGFPSLFANVSGDALDPVNASEYAANSSISEERQWWCRALVGCMQRDVCSEKTGSRRVCACPLDLRGSGCQVDTPFDCTLKREPAMGSLPSTRIFDIDTILPPDCDKSLVDQSGYDVEFSGSPPCFRLERSAALPVAGLPGPTVHAEDFMLACTFSEAVVDGISIDTIAELRLEGYRWRFPALNFTYTVDTTPIRAPQDPEDPNPAYALIGRDDYTELSNSTTYAEARRYCEIRAQRLPLFVEVCPSGRSSDPVGGSLIDLQWVPVGDGENQWVQVGQSSEQPLCQWSNASTGFDREPFWGIDPSPVPWRGLVLCIHPAGYWRTENEVWDQLAAAPTSEEGVDSDRVVDDAVDQQSGTSIFGFARSAGRRGLVVEAVALNYHRLSGMALLGVAPVFFNSTPETVHVELQALPPDPGFASGGRANVEYALAKDLGQLRQYGAPGIPATWNPYVNIQDYADSLREALLYRGGLFDSKAAVRRRSRASGMPDNVVFTSQNFEVEGWIAPSAEGVALAGGYTFILNIIVVILLMLTCASARALFKCCKRNENRVRR